jgi:hypothetical protein
MFKKWLPRLAIPAGMVLLVAGCGGKQNPVRIDTGSENSFFNGFWDGFTVLVVFVKDILESPDYQLYARSAPANYKIGYVLGVVLMVAVVLSIARATRPRKF